MADYNELWDRLGSSNPGPSIDDLKHIIENIPELRVRAGRKIIDEFKEGMADRPPRALLVYLMEQIPELKDEAWEMLLGSLPSDKNDSTGPSKENLAQVTCSVESHAERAWEMLKPMGAGVPNLITVMEGSDEYRAEAWELFCELTITPTDLIAVIQRVPELRETAWELLLMAISNLPRESWTFKHLIRWVPELRERAWAVCEANPELHELLFIVKWGEEIAPLAWRKLLEIGLPEFHVAFLMRDLEWLRDEAWEYLLSTGPSEAALYWVIRVVETHRERAWELLCASDHSDSVLRSIFNYVPSMRGRVWIRMKELGPSRADLLCVWLMLGHYDPIGREAYLLFTGKSDASSKTVMAELKAVT